MWELSVAGIAGADGFAEVVSDGAGAGGQHCTTTNFLASIAVQELYKV